MRGATQARSIVLPEELTREELAIAQSVMYASLFDYPLTLTQLRQTLIECELATADIAAAYEASDTLQSVVECRDGLYFPRGRADLCEERRRREARSRGFLAKHRVLLALACAIPYVRMVALSGSIAHMNLDGDGDLDLFIVTRGRHVWSVTVAVIVLAKLLGQRRLVCANFVIADSRLALDEGDLFTASQIIHLKPLVGDDVYRRFVALNPCVGRFYPNFEPDASGPHVQQPVGFARLKRAVEVLLMPISALAELACRSAYGRYLRSRAGSWRSPSQVRLEPDYLKLHTLSHRQSVLERFDRAVRQLFP